MSLATATALGLLLIELLMASDAGEAAEFGLYLALTGAAVLGVAWVAIELLERTSFTSLQTKAALGAIIATIASLISVLGMAALMFISTKHDLPLLIAVLSFAAVVSAAIAYLHAGRISSRVAALTETVELLASGRRGHAAVPTGDVELDLRTPLASVRASVEALADGVVPAADVPRYLDRIERDVVRLDRLIEDLFELAQLDAGAIQLDRRPLPIVEIAADVVDAMGPLASEQDVSLELSVEAEPALLLIDGDRIERVIGNLLRNALEHTLAGDSIRVSLGEDGDAAWVSVSDTGEGIAQSELTRVWERFVSGRSERGGSGLGLAIVRGIVHAHQGTVEVESSVGVGSVFTVRLPIEERDLLSSGVS